MLCASKQAKHHAARHVSRRQSKPGNCVRVTHESVCRFDGYSMLHAERIEQAQHIGTARDKKSCRYSSDGRLVTSVESYADRRVSVQV